MDKVNVSRNRARAQRYVVRLQAEIKKTSSPTVKKVLRQEMSKVQAVIDASYKNANTSLFNRMSAQQQSRETLRQVGKAVGKGVKGGYSIGSGVRSAVKRAQSVNKSTSVPRGYTTRAKNMNRVGGRDKALEALENLHTPSGRDLTNRINDLMRVEMQRAQHGETSKLGTKKINLNTGRMGAKEKIRIFYRSTQLAWEGRDPSKRDEYIMEALGVDTMAEAWDVVMDANKEVIDNWYGSYLVDDTVENEAYRGSFEHQDFETSPEYIYFTVNVVD